jgi:formylglycine-generating enzyme required for sulfatase activity
VYRAELEQAILERREIEELAENPVMLTCLCVVHWNERRQLPRGRAAAYKAVFHWLLEARREQRAELFPHGLAEYGLPAVALAMMLHAEGKQTTLAFAEAAHDKGVLEALQDVDLGAGAVRRGKIEAWLRWECTGSGVVQQEGPTGFRFWHLTFQELLAADALGEQFLDPSDERAWPTVRERLFDAQWKETVDLFPACLWMRAPRVVGGFLKRVVGLRREGDALAEDARLAALLHRLLMPLEAYDYVRPGDVQRVYDELFTRVQSIFEVEGARRVPWKDRLAVAEALGEAGDFRLQARDMDRMLEVPGGKGVKLGKYPVTVQEYAEFVREGGYEVERWWIIEGDREGWERRVSEKWTEPRGWKEQQRTLSRPVVGVSWFEAMAYCAWRSEKVRAEPRLRLPTEAEWQAAATHPGGKYPWGEPEPTDEHANFDSKVGHPTPVGMYPLGAAPGGHLDLTGNVWEWCVNRVPPQRQAFPSPPERAPPRALRGGSCWHVADGLRSAYRGVYDADFRSDGVGVRLALSPARLGP